MRLSNGRRLVDDVIRVAQRMPIAAMQAEYDVSEIANVRRMTSPKIAWNVLLMKAYAAVCARDPRLRQAYVGFPWPHLYQHHTNVCMMVITRQHRGEERLFFARFNEPENLSLSELQEQYDHFRRAPVEEIRQFRHQIMFAKFPALVRRMAWWALFNLWPQKRMSHMGTFGLSLSGYKGANGTKHLGPNTTTLGVDPLPRNAKSRVLFSFDHRVLDGTPATKVINQINHMLRTAVRKELCEMAGVDPKVIRAKKKAA